MQRSRVWFIIAVLSVVALLLTACPAAAPVSAPAGEAPAAGGRGRGRSPSRSSIPSRWTHPSPTSSTAMWQSSRLPIPTSRWSRSSQAAILTSRPPSRLPSKAAARRGLGVLLATDIYDLVNAGYVAPLDDYLAQAGDDYLADFYPAFMANSTYDGQIWSIPFQRSAVVLYYNADLLAEAGLERPDSWASWVEAMQALTVRDGDTVTRWGVEYSSDWPYWLFQPLAIAGRTSSATVTPRSTSTRPR
ncbi:MAG: extracellular solute-binding protein [Caldilineaceae bacterium]